MEDFDVDHMVFWENGDGTVVANRILRGDYRKWIAITANEDWMIRILQSLMGDQGNFIVIQPNSSTPPSPANKK